MQIDPAVHVITTAGSASGRKEICNHFCRTGRCKHGARCNYVHDRDKVALCRAYLSGTCQKSGDQCDLSHNTDPDRTPECGLFLRNLCINPSCKYLHVKKAPNAPVCDTFFSSWCPAGVNCPNRHYIAPTTSEKKRGRTDVSSEDGGYSSDDFDEDSQLRRIWEEEPSLKIYM